MFKVCRYLTLIIRTEPCAVSGYHNKLRGFCIINFEREKREADEGTTVYTAVTGTNLFHNIK